MPQSIDTTIVSRDSKGGLHYSVPASLQDSFAELLSTGRLASVTFASSVEIVCDTVLLLSSQTLKFDVRIGIETFLNRA
jgi:hypothetical protein